MLTDLVETQIDTGQHFIWREEEHGTEEVGQNGDDLETFGLSFYSFKCLGQS